MLDWSKGFDLKLKREPFNKILIEGLILRASDQAWLSGY